MLSLLALTLSPPKSHCTSDSLVVINCLDQRFNEHEAFISIHFYFIFMLLVRIHNVSKESPAFSKHVSSKKAGVSPRGTKDHNKTLKARILFSNKIILESHLCR